MSIAHAAARAAFRAGVILPLRVMVPIAGDRVWPIADAIAYSLAHRFGGLVGLVMRPGFAADPLRASMVLTDVVESVFGIEGDWEIIDGKTAVRRVRHCPFACPLRPLSRFCSLVGDTLGKSMLQAAAPAKGIKFEIVSTLSAGGDCCEYRVTLK